MKRDCSHKVSPGGGGDPADDHVADLALGVAGDDMDDFGGAHGRRLMPQRSA